ncbi:MAG: GntR family transcriptional regulator [Vulcanimicrobiaceae bacterium]
MAKRSEAKPIDRTVATPLYEQIKQRLLAELASSSGEQLPLSDAALMERFGVSRMTARNAIAELVRRGVVKRVPGRGTFLVPAHRLALHLDGVERFMQDWHIPHLDPTAKILTFRRMPAAPDVAARLQVAQGSTVILVRRVRHADGAPGAYDVRYVAGWCSDGITREDARRQSLFATIARESGIEAVAVEQEVGAVNADEQVAELLDVPRGYALLSRKVTFFTTGERPILTGHSLYRSDRFSFQMRAAR